MNEVSFPAPAGWQIWGRLLRVSLTATAVADVVAGVVFGAGGRWPPGAAPWLWILSSLAVYHGSMALNDYADRDHDARTRPERPLPSGHVRPGQALAVGLALVLAGPLLAALAQPASGLWMAGVAALALIYTFAGRGALTGPLLLAGCRAGNLGLGLFFAAGGGPHFALPAILLATLYAAYILLVSWLGRLEDREDGGGIGAMPTIYLRGMALILLAPALAAGAAPWPARLGALLLGGAAAAGLLVASRQKPWTAPLVMRSMGMALRRLLLFTTQIALLAWRPEAGYASLVCAALILAGYPLAHALRRLFPPS